MDNGNDRTAKIIAAAAAIITMLVQSASAVSIGAGPSTIDFGALAKGGYGESQLTVSTKEKEDLHCTIEYSGDMKGWVMTDQGSSFTLPANGRMTIMVYAQPPQDTPNGKYTGLLTIKAAPTETITSGAGLTVGTAVQIRLSAEVSGVQVSSLAVKKITFGETEAENPLQATAKIQNTGNVKITPNITMQITDKDGNTVLEAQYAASQIMPTREDEIAFTIPTDSLPPGDYTATARIYSLDKLIQTQTIPVKILPKGTFASAGTLETITLSTDKAAQNQLVKVTATFRNDGKAREKAKLKAEAYLNEKLVEALPDSEEIGTEPGKTASLETYYQPKEDGNHVIRGYVIYDGIKSDVKTTTLTVTSGSTGADILTIGAAAALIILAAAVYKQTRRGEPTERTQQ